MRKTIDLQLFADAVRGKKIVYLYRLKKDAAKNAATALAFTTENGRTTSKDADTTETKDGTIRTPGAAEVEIGDDNAASGRDEAQFSLYHPQAFLLRAHPHRGPQHRTAAPVCAGHGAGAQGQRRRPGRLRGAGHPSGRRFCLHHQWQ